MLRVLMSVMNVGRMGVLMLLRFVLVRMGMVAVNRGGFDGMDVALVIIAVMVAVFVRHC